MGVLLGLFEGEVLGGVAGEDVEGGFGVLVSASYGVDACFVSGPGVVGVDHIYLGFEADDDGAVLLGFVVSVCGVGGCVAVFVEAFP